MAIFRGKGTSKTGHGNATPSGGLFRPVLTGQPVLTVPSVLPNGTVATPYSYQISYTGLAVNWAVLLPAATGITYGLPPGLSLSNTGLLSGVPTLAGTWSFTVRADNNAGQDSKTVVIKIDPNGTTTSPPSTPAAPTISSSSMTAGTQNTDYSFTLGVTGTIDSYSWSGLPTGITASGGVLSGTPTVYGTFTVTATVTNTGGFATKTFSFVVDQALSSVTINPSVIRTHGPVSTPFSVTGTSSITISPKPSEGNTLVICLTDLFAGTTFTITDNQSASNVYTKLSAYAPSDPANSGSHIFYCQNIIITNPGIDYIITVTGPGSPCFEWVAMEVTGVSPATPVRAQVTNTTAVANADLVLNATAPVTPVSGDLAVFCNQVGYPTGATGATTPAGWTSLYLQADSTSTATHVSGYKTLSGASASVTVPSTVSDEMYGVEIVFRGTDGATVPVTPNPQDVLTTEYLIQQMTQPNVVQPSGSSGPYPAPYVGFDSQWGQPNDVKGPFVTASTIPSQGWNRLVPWGLVCNLPGGPVGAIDKLWVAVKNLQGWQHSPARGWERKAFLVAPGHDIYMNTQALNTPAPTYQLNPADDGARIKMSDFSLNAIWSGHSGVWHFYDYGGVTMDADADFFVTCFQVRVEGDTLADRDTQFPNSRMCAYGAGDLTSPGVNYTEIGHSKYSPLTKDWQWVGCAAGKTASANGVTPVPDSYYNFFRTIPFPSLSPQLILTQSDSRKMWWVDPKLTFANQPDYTVLHAFVSGPFPSLQSQPETGLLDPTTGAIALKRVPNPLNATDVTEANKVFLMRSGTSFTGISGIKETQVLGSGSTLGADYDISKTAWIGFSVQPGIDMVPAGTGGVLFNMNANASIVNYPPVQMYCDSGTIKLDLSSKTAPASPTDKNTELVWSDTFNGTDKFNIIIQLKMGHDVATHPMFNMWVQKNSGPLTQVVAKANYPIGYSDNGSAFYYQKFGINAGIGTGAVCTAYFKGFYMFNDTATPFVITKELMLALL